MAPKKRIAVKRQVWNKGLQIGKRGGFTPAQVKQIRSVLRDRGAAGVRDLALFSTAIDTMLHGHNLLTLVVADVQSRNGSIRPLIEVAQSKGAPPVRCALSKSTTALEKWITAAGLKRTDYLFPGGARGVSRPDEGSPHFEGHRRFADGSSTLGTCANREHSEISRSQNKSRSDSSLPSIRYLTVSLIHRPMPTDGRPSDRSVRRDERVNFMSAILELSPVAVRARGFHFRPPHKSTWFRMLRCTLRVRSGSRLCENEI